MSFNLVKNPWIKVVEKESGHETKVSLEEAFRNSQKYLCLSGDMKFQDLAVMRFMLAILTTVYTRFDADDNPYEWIELDDDMRFVRLVDEYDEDDLFDTWEKLYSQGHFSDAVVEYLYKNIDAFDMFGERPFYQVTGKEYDSFATKPISTGKGTVSVRQINRRISESNNSPSLFSPRSAQKKDSFFMDELVRWIITYQNYTGTTDKTKINLKEKVSNSAGWLYKLSPVYADGDSLFETLLLNLVLVNQIDRENYVNQVPVWENDSLEGYVESIKRLMPPGNIAALYTTWSRLMHIEWEDDKPAIYVAGLPALSNTNAFIEPMTIWRNDKDDVTPAARSIKSSNVNKAMWRDFGMYINVDGKEDRKEPGIVAWLRELKENDCIDRGKLLSLDSVSVISDGNATSQAPAIEVFDDMNINASVFFDKGENRWPRRIEDTIVTTQNVADDYIKMVNKVGLIRFHGDNRQAGSFSKKYGLVFYDGLNVPFKNWLSGLKDSDNRDEKIAEWKNTLKQIVSDSLNDFMKGATHSEIVGSFDKNDKINNIFTAVSLFKHNMYEKLE